MTVTAVDNRTRLLAGLSEALRERSYAELTVADVVRHAHTSKRTFYEQFADKHDCFVALLRLSNEELSSSIAAAVDPAAPWQDQIRQGVGALLSLVQAEPHLFLNWFRAVPALGDEGRELVRAGMAVFVDLMQALADTPDLQRAGVRPPTRELGIIVFGGLRELIATALEEGREPETLVEAASDAVSALLAPRA
ncbi:MAG: TetR/AcrR family transcriptional regulator [Nocardioides sp.]|uniref:TetR/AcrR family transcriptional regulator n=1 Tax=Nocardioides nematodiphilus TaxID=2849669 RepID=UPI001CD923F5|nr:TetR/AcrR family transcriptional regulator [Nocardioides nematodiphilus]MCA1984622.1 TetR/AcrR family transcriptional regulator [Nocardioides nematodiphilus]